MRYDDRVAGTVLFFPTGIVSRSPALPNNGSSNFVTRPPVAFGGALVNSTFRLGGIVVCYKMERDGRNRHRLLPNGISSALATMLVARVVCCLMQWHILSPLEYSAPNNVSALDTA